MRLKKNIPDKSNFVNRRGAARFGIEDLRLFDRGFPSLRSGLRKSHQLQPQSPPVVIDLSYFSFFLRRTFFCGLLFWLLPGKIVQGNSPASFILLGMDARAQSLGGIFAADHNGYSSFSRNPSALAYSSGTPLSTTAGLLPGEVKLFQLSVSKPIHGEQFGVHILNIFHPVESGMDETANSTSEFRNSDMGITFSYGKRLGKLGFGIGSNLIRKQVADVTGMGFSVSGAMYFPIHRRFSFGVTANDLPLSNLTMGDSSVPLPAQFRGGISAKTLDRDNFSLDMMTDIFSSMGGYEWAVGSELNLNETFFIRGGFSSLSQGIRIGLGMWFEKTRLDWSMQLGPLGGKDMMSFTLGCRF